MAEVAEDTWYVQFPEKVSGPFTFEQLNKLARSGRLSPGYMVTKDELVWQPASKLENLEFATSDTMVEIPKGHLLLRCQCGKEYVVQSSYSGMLRPCPKCGAKNRVPLNTAASEEAPLAGAPRPLALAIWTVVMIVATLFGTAALGVWWWQRQTRIDALDLGLTMLAAAAQMFLLFELRAGRYWAWVGLQLLWALTAFYLFILPGDWLASVLRAGAVLVAAAPMWAHLYTRGVVDYCFARRVE